MSGPKDLIFTDKDLGPLYTNDSESKHASDNHEAAMYCLSGDWVDR
jgi:hypothetical protein